MNICFTFLNIFIINIIFIVISHHNLQPLQESINMQGFNKKAISCNQYNNKNKTMSKHRLLCA